MFFYFSLNNQSFNKTIINLFNVCVYKILVKSLREVRHDKPENTDSEFRMIGDRIHIYHFLCIRTFL